MVWKKVSKYMMLCLLVLMLILAIRSLILPGAMAGVKFYLLPDFSKMQKYIRSRVLRLWAKLSLP